MLKSALIHYAAKTKSIHNRVKGLIIGLVFLGVAIIPWLRIGHWDSQFIKGLAIGASIVCFMLALYLWFISWTLKDFVNELEEDAKRYTLTRRDNV